jgi:hypothetical protein
MKLYNPQRHEMPIRLPRINDADVKVRPYTSIQLFPGEEKKINLGGVWQLLEDDEPNPPRPGVEAPTTPGTFQAVSKDNVALIQSLTAGQLEVIRSLSDEQLSAIRDA